MARLAVLSPLPPARSDAAMAGASLVKLLGRLDRHHVTAPWPIPESVEALLGVTDLPIYHVANDPEAREVYELAIHRPGLVVLHDLALDVVIRAGMSAHDPVAIASAREALASWEGLEDLDPGEDLRVPWCSYLLRRARGVVVHSSFAARYLEALGTRTPVFVAPPPSVADRRAVRGARRRARGLRTEGGPGGILGVLGEPGDGLLATVADAAAALRVRVIAVGTDLPEEQRTLAVPTGRLLERDLVSWVAACDAVVDASGPRTGALSAAAIRALQVGVPVVALPGHAVPDGAEEAVVVAGSEGDLPGAVERALRDPTVAERGRRVMERLAMRAPAAYREAVDRTLALVTDPVEWTLARWAGALLESGVTGEWVARGYGTGYTDALRELRPR